MNRHIQTAEKRTPDEYRASWTAQQVFNDSPENAEDVAERQAFIIQTEQKRPIAALMIARSQLFNELPAEKKAEYKAKAKAWTDNGPPKENLAKYVFL